MIMHYVWRWIMPAGVGLLMARVATAAPRYHLMDLGTLGGASALASDINASGQVSGFSSKSGISPNDGFLWQNGAMQDLGRYNTYAFGINASGQVVGQSTLYGAFLWQNGRTTYLDPQPAVADSINDNGQIVGQSHTREAFLWQNGALQSLGTLGGNTSYAYDINNSGQVTGRADISGDGASHAFLWQNGTMQDLGTLGGSNSGAYAINNNAQIVGYSQTDGNTAAHAFLWQNGIMQDLGGDGTIAYDINDSGQIVGALESQAMLWENGNSEELSTLVDSSGDGWSLLFGSAINSNGDIVGVGRKGGVQSVHAFLLTSTPEPSCLWLAGLATLLCGRRFRHREMKKGHNG
jgi:probable HAF family extracellular repeat protein